jgi:translation initiation factor IF-2
MEAGDEADIDVVGSAYIQALFEIKAGQEMTKIAGLSVRTGEIRRSLKYRVRRGGKIIKDELEVESLK